MNALKVMKVASALAVLGLSGALGGCIVKRAGISESARMDEVSGRYEFTAYFQEGRNDGDVIADAMNELGFTDLRWNGMNEFEAVSAQGVPVRVAWMITSGTGMSDAEGIRRIVIRPNSGSLGDLPDWYEATATDLQAAIEHNANPTDETRRYYAGRVGALNTRLRAAQAGASAQGAMGHMHHAPAVPHTPRMPQTPKMPY
ncbi:MAG: hypothetical protein AAGI30_02865 [Planctomycetota bacterium]